MKLEYLVLNSIFNLEIKDRKLTSQRFHQTMGTEFFAVFLSGASEYQEIYWLGRL